MAGKRPIDRIRDSGGSFQIGNPTEDGTVATMVEIDGSLYMITTKVIYAVQEADQIDRDRTNIDIAPIIKRKVLSFGSDSEIVAKILLTANNLFKGTFLPQTFDHKRALSISLGALMDMVAAHTTATEFKIAVKVALAAAGNPRQDASAEIPAIGDFKQRCKTFIQKVHHSSDALLNIAKLFYGDDPKKSKKKGWDRLHEVIKNRYGQDDIFVKTMTGWLPFLKLVLNTRDCLEHANTSGATVLDFKLGADGNVVPPTITVAFRDTNLAPVPIAAFMTQITQGMTVVFEEMIAFMCSKHVRTLGPFSSIAVGILPENRRSVKHLRFWYGSYSGEDFIPVGGG
jgi:hypothetical protein